MEISLIRKLTEIEEKNFSFISNIFPETSVLILTGTGLEKSIMDATITLRANLKSSKIHDYETQEKGTQNKVLVEASIWSNDKGLIDTKCSMYRPETKDGDPRIWFYQLKEHVNADVALAIIPFKKQLILINLDTFSIVASESSEFFTAKNAFIESAASDLLVRITEISKNWVRGVKEGDCSVGETLEQLLGIKQNSSKAPDFNGIELKSKRNSSSTRGSLFAQVPEWEISNFKSSKEILDSYGYLDKKSNLRKLYVTVSALKPNAQGLQLRVNYKSKTLEEIYVKDGKEYPVVRWSFNILFERLLTKHKETFWVKATSQKILGVEYLLYTSVEHTKKPIVENFLNLIEQGGITLDHLIKEKGNSAVEKGPIFKIHPRSFSTLFPSPQSYVFVEDSSIKIKIVELKNQKLA